MAISANFFYSHESGLQLSPIVKKPLDKRFSFQDKIVAISIFIFSQP